MCVCVIDIESDARVRMRIVFSLVAFEIPQIMSFGRCVFNRICANACAQSRTHVLQCGIDNKWQRSTENIKNKLIHRRNRMFKPTTIQCVLL